MVESRREGSCFLKACGVGKERLEKRENLFPNPLVYGNGRLEIRKRLRGGKFPDGRVGPFHMIGRHGLRAYIAVK